VSLKVFVLLLAVPLVAAAEPSRQGGLSVHMLPDHVAALDHTHGGFTVTDPVSSQPGDTFAEPKELLDYFQHLPATVQQNGIWVVPTHPTAYSESERAKLKTLVTLCAEKKILVFTCRASGLPGGWNRSEVPSGWNETK
jgi:hypothetical protein